MTEHRLFDPADPPEWLDPEWWRDRPHCDHLNARTGAHTARLQAAAAAADNLFGASPVNNPTVVVDLGAGDGGLLSLLEPDVPAVGFEIIEADVWYAQNVRKVDVRQCNVLAEDWVAEDWVAELGYAPGATIIAVLTEVLEHQLDPHGFLALLATRPEVRYVVASSPLHETPEEHEWNHAWAWDTDGYREMFVAAGFEALAFEPVEWSQVWTFERRVELTTKEAVAALEDEHEGDAVDAIRYSALAFGSGPHPLIGFGG